MRVLAAASLVFVPAFDFAKLFVNGVQVGSTKTTTTIPSGLSRLGFDSGGGSSRFSVKTKDVRAYNTALTDLELQ